MPTTQRPAQLRFTSGLVALLFAAAWSCGGGDSADGADTSTATDVVTGADGSLDALDDAESDDVPEDAPEADADVDSGPVADADPRPDTNDGSADIVDTGDDAIDSSDVIDADADVDPIQPTRCADLDCVGQFRECVDFPEVDSVCEGCLPGYIERDGLCAPDVRCASDAECGAPVAGEWGECVYAGECVDRGARERSVTSFVCESGACVEGDVVTESDEIGCRRFTVGTACAAGVGRCGPFECVLPPERVTGVDASDGSRGDAVVVTWTPVESASSYIVYRQGVAVTELGETTWLDTEAPAPSPPVVGELLASESRADGVLLEWSSAETLDGEVQAYTVVARNIAGDSAASLPDDGWRGAAPVDAYEWRQGSASPVDAGLDTSVVDTDAPLATIFPGVVTAGDALSFDRVDVQVTAFDVESGVGSWQVRARSADGVGPWTEPATGARASGRVTAVWQRTTSASAAGPWEDLTDGTDEGDRYIDISAPASGEVRYYRVRYSAPGAPDATTEPDAGSRRAATGLGAPCFAGADCSTGLCVDGVCCNSACGGLCQACNNPGSEGTCSPVAANTDPANECGDSGATSCGNNGFCDGAGACARYPAGTTCSAARCDRPLANSTPASQCDGAGTCVPRSVVACGVYTCNNTTGACNTRCTINGDCQPSFACDVPTGVCLREQGEFCTTNADCVTGFCADNVCCNTQCDGSCEACDQGDRFGFCDPIAAGTDRDNECPTEAASSCGRTGTCSGARACSLYPAGTVCAAATGCVTATDSQGARTCSGTGTCNFATTTSCIPYTCSSSACRTFCVTPPDCAPGFTCSFNQCVPF